MSRGFQVSETSSCTVELTLMELFGFDSFTFNMVFVCFLLVHYWL